MTIIVLQGQSQNNVLRQFAYSTHNAIQANGRSSVLVDLLETHWERRFQKLLSTESLSGIVAFNAVLGDLLSAELDIPYVAWLVDAPHYHFDRLRSSLHRRHVFCAAKHHLNFIKESSLSANATVLLSGCETLPSDIPIGGPRVHGVLIAASWMGRPENFWSNFNDNRLIAISKKSIELLNLNANVDAYQAVKSAAKINGANFEFNQFWMFLVSQVHSYIRKVDRINAVESLVASGLPLTLVGSGWSEHIALGRNVTVLESVDSSAMSALYRQAKVVVNLNASNGSSERLFEAMNAGAAVVSEKSAVLAEYFKDGRDIQFFDRKRPSSLPDVVKELLGADRYVSVAARGRERVRAAHTWDHRARSLLHVLDSIRA